MSDAHYKALASLLASKPPRDGKRTEELAAVKALGELQSVPLKKDGNQLIVTLPFYDRAKCGHHIPEALPHQASDFGPFMSSAADTLHPSQALRGGPSPGSPAPTRP